ncbi:hypothetical protein VCR4J5_1270094 [Vibrio crassostreae]|uniref:Uncharacterized protein n=1 Tax=Vibrio crassostreae TaxID=246167 RepID=A0A822MZZ3_9VIBR|nr:hypothetical protein VCR9J2_10147 [Vibrio crassostreae]CDS99852.1 hypothetical protein VCR4J5_1270094 [Vibrio crassostreae]CDT00574.1 hypothetical protein VCR19J5_1210069 [Vibrio crassostreae]CDT12042.1 hypothetical protein VCR15J5_320118 [Vibrio crassostreae]CDT44664.1 hypothetical protein VCR20J5_300118 [Vibrio crassostreae]
MSWWRYHRKTHLTNRTTNDRRQLGVTTWLIHFMTVLLLSPEFAKLWLWFNK